MSVIREGYDEELPSRLNRLNPREVQLPRDRDAQHRYPTATEILELIKIKKEELTNGGLPPPSAKSIRSSGKQVVLPRISTAKKEDVASVEVQPRSMSTSNIKHHVESDLSESESSNNRQEKNNSRRYLTLECEEINEADELQEMRNTESFQRCLGQIPQLTKFRNIKNMQPLVSYLRQTNPFFKNIPDILVSSMVKVCKLRNYQRGDKIFHRSDKMDSFFIILWGKVRLSDLISDYRKVSVRGETLCEQVLFDPNCPKLRFENAKSLTTTTLLEIPVYLYRKIYEQLVLYGYKSDFLAMESLIKRNFIFKQSIRSQANKNTR